MNIVTYSSVNARPGHEWLAYIDTGEYLPVRFRGATEADVVATAQAEWDKHEIEREEAKARREAARIKTAETLAKKKVAA